MTHPLRLFPRTTLAIIALGAVSGAFAIRSILANGGHATPLSIPTAPIESQAPLVQSSTLDDLRAAVARNPFNPARERPVQPYSPGQAPQQVLAERHVEKVEIPAPVLLGTSVGHRDVSAVLQIEGEAPILVEGDSVRGGLLVRRIRPGSVALAGADSAFTIHLKYSGEHP